MSNFLTRFLGGPTHKEIADIAAIEQELNTTRGEFRKIVQHAESHVRRLDVMQQTMDLRRSEFDD
jgi:hypothetical protein